MTILEQPMGRVIHLTDSKAARPRVSIVIVHLKGTQLLVDCLKSVLNSSYENFEVVLVDNGSTDGSIQTAGSMIGPKLKILTLPQNIGFAAATNVAAKSLQSDYVVFLNDDTIVDADWLNPLVQAAEADELIAACQPKLISLRQPGYFEYNGACGGMIDRYGIPLTRGRIFESAEKDIGQYDTSTEIFWASGAAMFVRLNLLRKAGFFDELLYAHMEEIDLSWRLRLLGFKIISVPSSRVYHWGGSTPLPSKMFLKQRNNLIVLIKNYSRASVIRYMPGRFIFDLMSLTYYVMQRDRLHPRSIVAAYLWTGRHLRRVMASRNYSQSMRKVSESRILSMMIAHPTAIQYYLLRRSRLSQLSGLPLLMISYTVWSPSRLEQVAPVVVSDGHFYFANRRE